MSRLGRESNVWLSVAVSWQICEPIQLKLTLLLAVATFCSLLDVCFDLRIVLGIMIWRRYLSGREGFQKRLSQPRRSASATRD